jgi:hypothetical protein
VQENASDFNEAQWVLEEAQQLHRRHGAPRDRHLYRSNAQSRVIESALFNAGIPYRVYGGMRFFERAEIKHALAYLRLIENCHDDTSYLRVVNFPTRGIGARTLEQLQDAARQTGRSLWQSVGGGRQGRRQPGGLQCADRRHAQRDPGPDAARDHRAHAAPLRAGGLLPPRRKAPTASRTWKNWSPPPRPSSPRRASARTPWPCRWTNWARAPSPRRVARRAAGARAGGPDARRRNRRDHEPAGGLPDPCGAGGGDNQAQAGRTPSS